MGVYGCDIGRQAQKSDHIYGRMAQLVVPTGYFVEISYGRMAQLVEHIVHIDGVTGSSPVATTPKVLVNQGLFHFAYVQIPKPYPNRTQTPFHVVKLLI